MWVARSRKTRSGFVLGEEERVSAHQALEAVTLGPARLLRKEAVLGSLEVGKFADFTALSGDPLQEDADALLELKVLETVVGGIPTGALR
jgi:predicted amidohydrolase YtcJ